MAEPDPLHGFVEPCTVAIVQDNTNECEACSATPDKPELCNETLGQRGYERKCRTSGHSAPAEVWCISKRRKEEQERRSWTWYVPIVAAAAASALFGAFLYFKRRRRPIA